MAPWRYLTSEELIILGAAHGVGPVIKPEGLQAAIAAPAASFAGVDRHPEISDKAAALAFAIAKIYHPFLDGNKRVAAIGMMATCWLNGFRPKVLQSELVGFIMAVAELNVDESDDDTARADLAGLLRMRMD